MTSFADQLLVLVMLINFVILGSSRMAISIRAVALQGVALGILPGIMHSFSWHLIMTGGCGTTCATFTPTP